MANNFTLNVSENLDLDAFSTKITQMYQAKGYGVNTLKMKNGVKFTVEKGLGGINTILGMGEGITVTCMLHGNNTVSVNFSDAEWTGKIVGLIVGWFLCWVPCVTAIMGIMRQTGLEKSLANDIQMALNDGQ